MGCENEESKVRTMERVGSPLSMILVQILSTGMFLLSKLVLDGGRFIFAILTYRCIVGALFVLPFALVMERKKWSEVNWIAGFWIFCNALTGITAAMALYYYGLRDTNATYGASFLNLVPVVTFLFAVLMRLERLGLDSRGGRIKILGTLLCLGGAMVLSMYFGLTFHIPSLHLGANGNKQITEAADHHTVRGTLFLVGSCISFSAWAIVQAKLLQVYPFKYCATMYTCIVASLQSLAFGWALNSKRSAWKLQWDLQLLLVLYSGALNTGAVFCLVSWVVAIKGPSYSAMFNALSLVLTTLLEAFS
ncbi:hypothetical protein HPP92_021970 [Vanilla planifolia]|uniref:WAT1-related protein n=1 Tax=Vanilla planifolia TaxID=51239 RepID=A0A835UEP3_VANPL|nr:hypothetical protein HPP92_021970 [Vanilla planifolia]